MSMCGRDEPAIPKGPAHGQTPPPHLSGSFNLDVNMRCQTAPTMEQVIDPTHWHIHIYKYSLYRIGLSISPQDLAKSFKGRLHMSTRECPWPPHIVSVNYVIHDNLQDRCWWCTPVIPALRK